MLAILIPSFDTPEDALDWLDAQGTVLRVCLMRGMDGKVRGNALVRRAS